MNTPNRALAQTHIKSFKKIVEKQEEADRLMLELFRHPEVTDNMILTMAKETAKAHVRILSAYDQLISYCDIAGVPDWYLPPRPY